MPSGMRSPFNNKVSASRNSFNFGSEMRRKSNASNLRSPMKSPTGRDNSVLDSYIIRVKEAMNKGGMTGLLELKRQFIIHQSNKNTQNQGFKKSNSVANSRRSRSSKKNINKKL